MSLVKILASLFPVFLFLAALVFLDSFKLVRLRAILLTIFVGCVVAAVCLLLNSWLLQRFAWEMALYSRYVAPIIEETLKAAYLVYLVKSEKIGFMVDAAIQGFALGAGFALVENVYYLQTLQDANLFLWVVRGFGTAIMHGGTTAVVGIIAKGLSERHASERVRFFLPGLGLAVFIHSVFNHFLLPPVISTVSLLMALPLIIIVAFTQSEQATRHWLGAGFDTDMELMELITTGNFSESKIGLYLQSLKTHFPPEVVADMLCLLRIHVELAMRAKGILLMRGTGFRIATDPEIKEKFEELKYLEKSIGKTGQLAIAPFLHTSSRDLWQLYMLGKK
ncbi:MAG: PrsW family intramembrane metalloprotease [candidate division KSB1 bacterium]|nr:PrsW family intramembrane metalloprotease [candidate division KSB1 bacterium]MDZ7303656.1 PrsW family intramembrane metalloprotease [candidate division KSB1 bacterium]MDZ7313324.1 PrsW family intramembrane metalloprotease [candidate division KSB1 bacterium]